MTPVVITLTDFGLARKEPCPPARMSSFCGSLEFLAPEMVKMIPQIQIPLNQGYGKEVDIWAIGIIAYAIMSGDLPFSEADEEANKLQILSRIIHDDVCFGDVWSSKSKLGM